MIYFIDEYHDSVGNGSSASRSSSPISPNDEMTLNQLMWPFLPANFVDFDMHGNGIYYGTLKMLEFAA